MDNTTFHPSPNKSSPIIIGSLIIAATIIIALLVIVNIFGHRSHNCNPHVNVHCPHGHMQEQFGEFLDDWQAASFLRLNQSELINLAESGELDGTFTTRIQVDRWYVHPSRPNMMYPANAPFSVGPDDFDDFGNRPRPPSVAAGYQVQYTETTVYTFSRTRLIEWMEARMDGGFIGEDANVNDDNETAVAE
ncbi:MAG: hypothetical protein FWB93_02240 [Oscillospiraceae bacterium]|nr:hypothetical protein [Oscillospiraceae bacterium]